jgi:hypothetical protein
VSPRLLLELSDLFSFEALAADLRHDSVEADRLWGIADKIHARVLTEEDEVPTERNVR